MRVVSMVPSWTETLIECDVEVVGRTRFCIHPQNKIRSVTVVGGTKDIQWNKVESLNPDYIILDREENPKSMAEESRWPVLSTHVQNINDVPNELSNLNKFLKSEKLSSLVDRWRKLGSQNRETKSLVQLHKLSEEQQKTYGIQSWLKKPERDYSNVVYVIWKNPWMAVTQETFIGSALDLIGLPTSVSEAKFVKKYPVISLEDFDQSQTLFLFSSEPFPFHKKIEDLKNLNLSSAIIDGESYSWFGIRSLKFLEHHFR